MKYTCIHNTVFDVIDAINKKIDYASDILWKYIAETKADILKMDISDATYPYLEAHVLSISEYDTIRHQLLCRRKEMNELVFERGKFDDDVAKLYVNIIELLSEVDECNPEGCSVPTVIDNQGKLELKPDE